jgi:membrane protein required for colicin V production
MTALDMALLLLTGGMALFGFMRGLVQEALSLLAWVVAVIAVRLFLAPVTDLVGLWMEPGGAASILAFAGLFAVTFFTGKMVARWVGQRTRASMLGSVDRVLGAGFGVVKGLVVATLAFLAFTLVYNMMFGLTEPRPEWMTRSRSYPLLRASGDAMSQFVRERNQAREEADNAMEAVSQ